VSAAIQEEAGPSVDDIVRALEFDILFGRLKPRERLVEDALIARFGAKRHTVRRALDELVRIAIVVRAPNRGATVRDFSAKEVEEIYELRELLQRRAVERMPLPPAPAHLDAIQAVQRRHDAAVLSNDLRVVDQVNDEFHCLLFSTCGNAHLTQAIAHYAHLSRAMRVYPMSDPVTLEKLRDEHWAMIAALRSGDRSRLLELVARHIQPSKAAYLLVRKGLD
jgi:DNA-binding GntR family transcriptional regulator